MDSLSQMALGAAVAEASLGRRIGRRALLIGAALGTLPDLDVVVQYADAIDAFTRHRSFSHSLFVLSLLSLPLSALCRRWLDRECLASAGRWLFTVWAVLITHALLDAFTVYGTQLFWPLPVRPVGIASIFIIDPLYTLPLLLGLLLAWRWRDPRGRRANALGLILAQSWLVATLVLQQVARAESLAVLKDQGISPTEMRVLPFPLGVMWRTLALDGDDVLEGWLSLVDGEDKIRFDRIPRDLDQLKGLESYPPVTRLDWFTGGFMALRAVNDIAVLTDLRMGSITNPVFSFDIAVRADSGFDPIPTLNRQIYVCWPEVRLLMQRMFDSSIELPIAELPGESIRNSAAADSDSPAVDDERIAAHSCS